VCDGVALVVGEVGVLEEVGDVVADNVGEVLGMNNSGGADFSAAAP
jgi:hypothetical protein